MRMLLSLENITKSFDDKVVLQNISLRLSEGEIVVLLGPSGCGKTTLLRIIAGLEQPDEGAVWLEGRDLSQIQVHQRGFGFVFQDYALFPHKNVFQNVAFGLRMLNWERPLIIDRVNKVLELVGLAGFNDRPIHELSGGEQQRVALARSLAPAPRLLLLDEPLGALDRALRERLMIELRSILKKAGGIFGRPEGITAVYVTHDQAEAFAIADRIVVVIDGKIEQVDPPARLYQRPATPFVARFLGMDNIFEAELISTNPCKARIGQLDLNISESDKVDQCLAGDKVTLLIRPEAGQLTENKDDAILGQLQYVSFRGRYQIVTIKVSEFQSAASLKLEFDSSVPLPQIGSKISFVLDSRAIVLLKRG